VIFSATRICGADTADVPGVLHQGILWLFKDDPWLAHDLLGLLGVNPSFPDLVLIYQDPDDPKRGIVICLEAQRKSVPQKRWQISVYQGLLAGEHELDVVVVVVSFSPAFSRLVRSWAHSSPKIEALVLDADNVPVMTLEQARAPNRSGAGCCPARSQGQRRDGEDRGRGNLGFARATAGSIRYNHSRRAAGTAAGHRAQGVTGETAR
jgi:hypothetical protein